MLVRVVPGLFPPDLVVQVKALACELPATHGIPLSRWSTQDLVQQVQHSGLVASLSGSTLWRWLHEDAIRPWYHRSWIFPRDPDFAARAGRVLDLYAREWQGKALQDDEFVISADEKTSIQARHRKHATQACRPRTPRRIEHEYFRCGAWTYIAALDVHHARVFGRCEPKNGIAPFDRAGRASDGHARPTTTLVASFGSSTTARSIVAPKPCSSACGTLYPRPCHARACAGSCQLAQSGRNLLLDSSEKSSHAQRFRPISTSSPSVSSTFNTTGKPKLNPSNGSSLARILQNS